MSWGRHGFFTKKKKKSSNGGLCGKSQDENIALYNKDMKHANCLLSIDFTKPLLIAPTTL